MDAMPELLERTRGLFLSAQAEAEPRRLAATAAAVALWSAFIGMVLCVALALVGWLAGSAGSGLDAVRAGVQMWLLGHGSGLHAGSTTVTALPLGLTLLFALVLWRTGVWAAGAADVGDLRSVGSGSAIVAAGYACVAMAAALLSATDSSAVSPLRAFLSALLLAGVFSGLGLLRGSGVLAGGWGWLPQYARAALHGAAAAVLTMFAAGTLLVSAALALDFGSAANVTHAMDAGVVGGALMTLAGVLLLPNAALLGASYLLGPGFAFGSGTLVAPTGVQLGRVPAFPLLAALPDEGPVSWSLMALLAVPVVAGVLAALVALRHHPTDAYDQLALRTGLAGLAGGVSTGLLTGLAGGAVGPGRMADVGAQVLACAGVGAAAMGLSALLTGVLVCWRGRRRAAVG